MPNLYREQRAAEQFADQHRRQRDPHAEAFAHWARTPSMTQAERRQQQAEQAEAARVAKIRKFQADFPGLEVPPEWGSAPAPILTAADAEAARKAALKAALADDSLSLDEVLEYTDAFDRDETRQRVFARIHAKHDALAKEPPDIKALRAAQPNLFTPAQGPTAAELAAQQAAAQRQTKLTRYEELSKQDPAMLKVAAKQARAAEMDRLAHELYGEKNNG